MQTNMTVSFNISNLVLTTSLTLTLTLALTSTLAPTLTGVQLYNEKNGQKKQFFFPVHLPYGSLLYVVLVVSLVSPGCNNTLTGTCPIKFVLVDVPESNMPPIL